MKGQNNGHFEIFGDVKVRTGSYANLVSISSGEREEIVNFILVDEVKEGERLSGVLTARVIMSTQTLIELRDAITNHLEKVTRSGGEGIE